MENFFLIRSITYENLRLTANNRDNPRQRTLKVVCGRPALEYSEYAMANITMHVADRVIIISTRVSSAFNGNNDSNNCGCDV